MRTALRRGHETMLYDNCVTSPAAAAAAPPLILVLTTTLYGCTGGVHCTDNGCLMCPSEQTVCTICLMVAIF